VGRNRLKRCINLAEVDARRCFTRCTSKGSPWTLPACPLSYTGLAHDGAYVTTV